MPVIVTGGNGDGSGGWVFIALGILVVALITIWLIVGGPGANPVPPPPEKPHVVQPAPPPTTVP